MYELFEGFHFKEMSKEITENNKISEVLCLSGQRLKARLVIDASGHKSNFVKRPFQNNIAQQAAYGIVGKFSTPPVKKDQFVLMDFRPDHLNKEGKLPLVRVIFIRGGSEEVLLEDLIKNNGKGAVIAGFGAGTLPDTVVNQIAKMERTECVIVVSSRVQRVMVMSETMTQIEGWNSIPSGFLNPHKSALLLSLALEDGLQNIEIESLFKKLYG